LGLAVSVGGRFGRLGANGGGGRATFDCPAGPPRQQHPSAARTIAGAAAIGCAGVIIKKKYSKETKKNIRKKGEKEKKLKKDGKKKDVREKKNIKKYK